MRAPEAKSYSPPFDLGKPLMNFGVSEVLRSDHADFKKGQRTFLRFTLLLDCTDSLCRRLRLHALLGTTIRLSSSRC